MQDDHASRGRLPLLDATGNALDGKLATLVASGETAVCYHPGAYQYLAGRAKGIKQVRSLEAVDFGRY